MSVLKRKLLWLGAFFGAVFAVSFSGVNAEVKTTGVLYAGMSGQQCQEQGWPAECCVEGSVLPDYCCEGDNPSPFCDDPLPPL